MPRPRKKLPLEVEMEIRRLALEGATPAQVLGFVRRRFGGADAPPELREAVLALDAKTVHGACASTAPPTTPRPGRWPPRTASRRRA